MSRRLGSDRCGVVKGFERRHTNDAMNNIINLAVRTFSSYSYVRTYYVQ